MHESKKAYDNQLSEVMKTLSKLQAVPDSLLIVWHAAQERQSSQRVQATVDDFRFRDDRVRAAAAEARALQEAKAVPCPSPSPTV